MAVKALVVTYEPSPAELEACLHALSEQVAETVVVDNHSSNIRVILQLAERYGTRVIELDGNYGVYGAANRGIPYVEDANWVLFLDQDSEVRCELSEIIRAAEALGIKAMSLSTAYETNSRSEMFFEEDFAIFSGLIVNGELLRKGLRFDDSIFVDQGDFEFSWKIRSMGYKIMSTTKACLKHKLGEPSRGSSIEPAWRMYFITKDSIRLFKRRILSTKFLLKQIGSWSYRYLSIRRRADLLFLAVSRGFLDGMHENPANVKLVYKLAALEGKKLHDLKVKREWLCGYRVGSGDHL